MIGRVGALVRRTLGIVPVVSREEARELARAHALARGWPWLEPVLLGEGLTTIAFRTNASMRGGNVNVRVRWSDGAIASAAFAQR